MSWCFSLNAFFYTIYNALREKYVFVGDLPGITGLHNIGIGAGSILLSPVQASALGMLQGPDGAINLLNNIQVGTVFVCQKLKFITTHVKYSLFLLS